MVKTMKAFRLVIAVIFVLLRGIAFADFMDCLSPNIYKNPKTDMNKNNIAPLTEADAIRAGWSKMSDWGSLYHIRGNLLDAVGVVRIKEAIGKSIESAIGTEAYDTIRPLIEQNLDTALDINHKYVDPDGHGEATYLPDGSLLNKGNRQGTYNDDSADNWVDHFCSAIVNHMMVQLKDLEYDPTKKCFVVSEDKMESPVDCDTGRPVGDTLKSLADFLETGEEIVEVRERKAAEEERLRQQQLAAQRKQNQKRESETKSNKATTRETPKSTATSQSKPAQKSTTPTQTKQTTTVTTQPKQTVSASFDMSKLTSIYEKRMAVLEEIYALPDGEPASADQRQKVNAYLDEYKAELSRLEKVLDNGPKNNTWFNYGLELNIKKDGQTTLMTRMMQRCRNAGKF